MLKRAAIVVAGIAAAASPLYAQAKTAPAGDIAKALTACLQATSASSVDEVALATAGWSTGSTKKPGETPVRIFGKADNAAMIFALSGGRGCVVNARLADVDRYASIAGEISRLLQEDPLRTQGNEVTWRYENVIVQLNLTGTLQGPSIRAGVIAVQEEKK